MIKLTALALLLSACTPVQFNVGNEIPIKPSLEYVSVNTEKPFTFQDLQDVHNEVYSKFRYTGSSLGIFEDKKDFVFGVCTDYAKMIQTTLANKGIKSNLVLMTTANPLIEHVAVEVGGWVFDNNVEYIQRSQEMSVKPYAIYDGKSFRAVK